MIAPPKIKPILQIQVVDGPNKGKCYEFDSEIVRVGRGEDNDIVLDHDKQVSRSHLTIVFKDNAWEACDNMSSNGTFLQMASNLFKIHETIELYPSARLQIGGTRLEFSWPS